MVNEPLIDLAARVLLSYIDSGHKPTNTISYEQWEQMTIPDSNVDKCYNDDIWKAHEYANHPILEKFCDDNNLQCTNIVVYPPGSYMSWHTNKDNSGTRTYYVWSRGAGFFRTENTLEQEQPGLTIRSFETPQWHTIYAVTTRVAFGFKEKEV